MCVGISGVALNLGLGVELYVSEYDNLGLELKIEAGIILFISSCVIFCIFVVAI